MDWVLSVTTLLANANLGWSKGVGWAWLLWAGNAAMWQVYVVLTEQWGFTILNFATMGIGIWNAKKNWRKDET